MMLTVTVPNADLLHRLQGAAGAWADKVELIPWDMQAPLPSEVAAKVNLAIIGHYWEGKFDWNLLKTLPNLQIVQLPSAGYEHAAPFVPPGVTLCNGRGVHSAETAELAVGLILAMQRGIADAREHQRNHQWVFTHLDSLADRRVIIVGNGSVGQALAARLKPFEVEIKMVAREAEANSNGTLVYPVKELVELVENADIVALAVPANAETYHLIDDEILTAMPDGALLVNVARGTIVDQQALLKHLQAGRLRAALDVTTPEPLPPDDPLWDAPNVLITPHQGGNTNAGYSRFGDLVQRQINHLVSNEPLENVVTK